MAKAYLTRAEKEELGYGSWANMIQRCTNPNKTSYLRYGGRGITVCPEWSQFTQFLEDMGPRPFKGASIDRVNNSKGYDKENCKWSGHSEQNLNQRVRVDNKLGERGISKHGDHHRVVLHRNGKFFRSARTTTLESAIKVRDFFLEELKLDK